MSENFEIEIMKYLNEGFNTMKNEINASLQALHEKINETNIEVAKIQPKLEMLTKKVDETNHFKERLIIIEEQHKGNLCKYNDKNIQPQPKTTSPFWKEKWFTWLIATGCIIALGIVGVAIGTNLFSHVGVLK